MPPPNNVFQPTRCAALTLEDQWHFGASTNLSMLYPRSERLNTSRSAVTVAEENQAQMEIREIPAEETRPIRREVLKPGLAESEVHLPGDEDPSTFPRGAFEQEDVIGGATFHPEACSVSGTERDWRLRGMATRESMRNAGVGGVLLQAGIARARHRGGVKVWCN